jgi:hypothetical protein
MSIIQSPGTCLAFRTLLPEKLRLAPGNLRAAGDFPSPALMEVASPGTEKRLDEQFLLAGIDISAEEFRELNIFDEFLAYHVQPNTIFNVQCMLLWNEWIRTFRRRAHGFPSLIREKEFRSVILDKFGIKIARSNLKGVIYCGLRFVP